MQRVNEALWEVRGYWVRLAITEFKGPACAAFERLLALSLMAS